jgi:hypothetical protein
MWTLAGRFQSVSGVNERETLAVSLLAPRLLDEKARRSALCYYSTRLNHEYLFRGLQ